MTGIALFAHGSRVESANEGVRAVAAQLAEQGPYPAVEAAFLELGEPELPEAIGRLVARGAQSIVVIPYFLTLGTHLRRDLPRIVSEIARIHEGVRIEVTEPMEGHPALISILMDRAKGAGVQGANHGGGGSESQAG